MTDAPPWRHQQFQQAKQLGIQEFEWLEQTERNNKMRGYKIFKRTK